ncbi:MAG: ABC transporter permease [Dehalococcoidia bacterium]|nr:ABC transporter permease [Dehalococcoidia bacterium]
MATATSRQLPVAVDAGWETLPERPWYVRWRRIAAQNPLGVVALLIVVGFFVLGLVGPYVAPYPPRQLDAAAQFLGPSWAHPFGTNETGNDMFSRVLVGARVSMTFGAIVIVFGFVPGALLGVLSGYAGRWIDYVLQRSSEAWSAFPQVILVLTFLTAFGPGLRNIEIVTAIGAVFGSSRVLRAVAIIEKQKDYVLAAHATGASDARIFARHVLPNVMPYIIVGISGVFAAAVVIEATLSFLGLGLAVGTPGWGIDLNAAIRSGYGQQYPFLVLFPGLAISLVVLGFNLLGDTLRDILDPRLRGSR